MDRICWSEKSIPLRNLVENSAIQKPALAQIGSKCIIVGDQINGQFIMASPCKVTGDRLDVMDKEIVLSSKHAGIWKVISKSESMKENHIHRFTTKDMERIHKQDIINERISPRSYICTKSIEAFELTIRYSDPAITAGHRIDKRVKKIEENVEFIINDTGEVEYTPTEGERTSQDYVIVPKSKASLFLQRLTQNATDEEQLLRNRILRSLSCTTKNDTHRRHFNLEVNEESCDIRPIASDGSTELRYLHSTQNLFEYMSTYGNDTMLFVKLVRGEIPVKIVEFDGYMVFKSTLNGDRIPICHVDDLQMSLVNPDLSVKIKLPTSGHTMRSLSDIRAAELQCMKFSLSLFSRHESEMYVTVEDDKNTSNFLQINYNQEQKVSASRQSPDANRKHFEESEKNFNNNLSKSTTQNDLRSVQSRTLSSDDRRIRKQQESPKMTRVVPAVQHVPEKLDRNGDKRVEQSNHKLERQRSEQGERDNQIPQTSIRHKTASMDQESPKVTRAAASSHPASDRLYREDEKRGIQNNYKPERQRPEQGDKDNQNSQTMIRYKPMPIVQQSPAVTRIVPPSHQASDKLYRNEEKRIIQTNHKPERQRFEQGEKDNHTSQTSTPRKKPTSSSTSFPTITK